MRLRDRLGISTHRQEQLSRAMELSMVGLLFIGIERGNVGIVVNTGLGLLVTQLPPVLERDYDVPMDAGLTLWITSAVFLHALGTVGFPGSPSTFYSDVPWWDHMTHALSSSLVAAVGYATVRAVDEHSDALNLPPRFVFWFLLMFVVAFGVFWEVIEFTLGELAVMTGVKVLTQYGLDDTMLDLLFDVVGGVIVATWGTAYLTDVVSAIRRQLETRATK